MATNSLKREAETFHEHEQRLARMTIPEVLKRYKRHTWAVTMDVTNDDGQYKTSQVWTETGLRHFLALLNYYNDWTGEYQQLVDAENGHESLPSDRMQDDLRDVLNILQGMDESAHAALSKGADCQMMLEVIQRETHQAIERTSGLIEQ